MSGQMSGHVCVFDVFWYMLTVIITILPNILESPSSTDVGHTSLLDQQKSPQLLTVSPSSSMCI